MQVLCAGTLYISDRFEMLDIDLPVLRCYSEPIAGISAIRSLLYVC